MKRMTYEEIKQKYPDEWVLLEDIEEDDSLNIISGIVVAHGPRRSDISKYMTKRPGNYGIRFTGEMKGIFALDLFQ